jgi:hypothetical protein
MRDGSTDFLQKAKTPESLVFTRNLGVFPVLDKRRGKRNPAFW